MVYQRRVIIGAIGGDRQMSAGLELGKIVTQRGLILLTGGRLLPQATVESRGEVKDASMLGAFEAEPHSARLIGILPTDGSSRPHWEYSEGARQLFLHTGLPHFVRNFINGRTPDVVVAFGGSRGTLAEIAFALKSDRPVIFAAESLARLRARFQEFFGEPSRITEDRHIYFDEPLNAYREAIGLDCNSINLLEMLTTTLHTASEVVDIAGALDSLTGERAVLDEETGFPGLPGDAESKARFESIVRAISK